MDDSKRRRLPPWMLGVAASKSSDGEEIHASSQNRPPSNSNFGITHPQQEEDGKDTSVVKSILPFECEAKRTKRKLRLQDAHHGGDAHGTDLIAESAPKRGRKGRKIREEGSRFESREEAEISSPLVEDGELTVEDLMRIAHEYVEADKVLEQQKLSNKECEQDSHFPATTISRSEAEVSVNAAQSERRLQENYTVASYNSTASLTGEGIVSNPCRTGDPAQDMLNLFLGPLLKKPLEEKNHFEFVTEDITCSHEFKKQYETDFVEKIIPLTKKKSSLKDKVAALLD